MRPVNSAPILDPEWEDDYRNGRTEKWAKQKEMQFGLAPPGFGPDDDEEEDDDDDDNAEDFDIDFIKSRATPPKLTPQVDVDAVGAVLSAGCSQSLSAKLPPPKNKTHTEDEDMEGKVIVEDDEQAPAEVVVAKVNGAESSDAVAKVAEEETQVKEVEEKKQQDGEKKEEVAAEPLTSTGADMQQKQKREHDEAAATSPRPEAKKLKADS